MLELHQFQIARDQVEVRDIGLADDSADRLWVVIADRVIERAAICQIKLGLYAM